MKNLALIIVLFFTSTFLNVLFAVGPSLVQEVEPNDDIANSNDAGKTVLFHSHLSSAIISGNMSADTSSDYYEYYLDIGDTITTSLEQHNGLQVQLFLKNSSSSVVDSDTTTSGNRNRISNYNISASGNYYIVLTHASGSGNYDLLVTSNSDGFHETEVLNSNNNSGAAEYLHQFNTTGGNLEFAGTIGTAEIGDDDWYYFQLREGQDFSLNVETFNGLAPNVRLFDHDLNPLHHINTASTNYLASFPSITNEMPGLYYLRVSGNSGEGLFGSYYISGVIDSDPSVIAEEESNDNIGSATTLTLKETFPSSNIHKVSALGAIGLKENSPTSDYYIFSGNVGDQVTITLDHVGSGFTARLVLLNSSQSTLSATGYVTDDKRISAYTLPNDDIYYVLIDYSSGNGSYELNLILNKDGFNEEESFNENDSQVNAEIIPFKDATGNVLNLANVNGILDEDDEDWYFIYLRENQTLTLNVETTGNSMANIQLFDPDLQLIEAVESTSPNQILNFAPFQTVTPGSYYLNLKGISGNGVHANYTFIGDVVGEASHGFDIEPNDSATDSTPFSLSELFPSTNIFKGSAVGSIGLKENVGTKDFFHFTGSEGDQVTITLDYISGDLNTRLRLLSPNGATAHVFTGYDTNDKRIAAFTLPLSGDNEYRVEVGYSSGTGVYELSLLLNKDGYNEEEVFNENDSSNLAEVIPFQNATGNLLDLAEVSGIADEGDEDWYFVYLRENQTINLSLESTGGLMANVQLFDPNFQLIESLEASTPNELLNFTPFQTITPGSYYLNIKGISGNGYHSHYTFVGDVTGEASHGFDIEPNDSVANATPFSTSELYPSTNILKGSAVGSIGLKENTATSDYYIFSGNAGDQVTITLDYISGDLSTRLVLMNSAQSILSGTNYTVNDKRISAYTLPTDDIYYLYVDLSSGSGVYELSMVQNKDGFNEEEVFYENETQANAEIIPFANATGNVLELANVNGIIDEADEDWYFIYLRENQSINLFIETQGSLMANVQLLDPQLQLIEAVESTSPNQALNFAPFQTVTPGSYYIRLTGISGNGYHSHYTFVGDVIGEASHGFDIEPNDSAANATPFSTAELFPSTNILKGSAVGSIGLKENTATSDYYIFSGNAGDEVTITLDYISGDLSTRLVLMNSAQSILSGTNYTINDKRISAYTLPTDDIYYLYVDHSTGSGVYELSMVQNKDGFNEEELFYENETQANAEIIPFSNATGNVLELAHINGIIDEDDEDWYFIYLRENQSINLFVETQGSLMANIQLLDPELQLIEAIESTSPNQVLSFAPFQTVTPGSYYIRLTGISGNGYHSHYTFVGDITGEASHGFDIEPNDSAANATPFSTAELFPSTNILKGSAVGSIGLKENSGTSDYYVFSGNAGDQVTITLDYISGSLSTRIALLNSAQSILSGTNYTINDKRISAYTLPTDDIYYLYVDLSSGSGVYELSMVQNKDGFNEEELFYENETQADAEIIPFANATGNVLELAHINGIIDEDDEDWYFIYLRENQSINLFVETQGSLMANVQLLDPQLQLIEAVESTSPNQVLNFAPYQTVAPGSYYIKLNGISGNGYHSHYTFVGDVTGEASHGFDIEPNDSAANATGFQLTEAFPSSNIFKGSAVGSIGLKENNTTDDYFIFSGNAGDQVSITLDYISGDLSTRLALLNSSQSILSGTSYTVVDKKIAAFTLPSNGTFYLLVDLSSGTGVYELSMTLSQSAWMEQEAFNQNDSFANAEFIAVNNEVSNTHSLLPLTGVIQMGDTGDKYLVPSLTNMTLNIDLEVIGNWKPKIELFKNQVSVHSVSATVPNEFLNLNFVLADYDNDYHVEISSLSDESYHAQYYLTGTLTGDASRTVNVLSNNSFGTAQLVQYSNNAQLNTNEASVVGFHSPADTSNIRDDYFKFPVNSGDNLNLFLNNASSMDLDVFVYDDTNTLLHSEVSNSSADKSIDGMNITQTGNIIVKVNHQTGEGLYSLHLIDATNLNPLPTVVNFSPLHERRALSNALTATITYDQDIGLGTSGNLVLYDLTNSQTVIEVTNSNNSLVSISMGNRLTFTLNQILRDYNPDPYTEFAFFYEPGFLTSTDNTPITDFPSPWNFSIGDVRHIAMGETTTLLLRNDQHLWGFGDSVLGESGNIESPITNPEIDTNNWWSVSVGAHHSLAIDLYGYLYSFGDNRKGQTGQASDNLGILPLNSPSKYIQVSAGTEHSLVLKNNTRLFTMGKNNFGQLGLGDTTDRNVLTEVNITFWSAIAAGSDFSLAIRYNDNALFAWGNSAWGIFSSANNLIPSQIGVASDWLAVSAGHRHALALKTDSSLYAWGNNQFGQLGLSDQTSRSTPLLVSSNVKTISAGGFHSLFIDEAGNLYSFGRNSEGQLGLGDYTDRLSPELVNINGEIVKSVSAGPYSSSVIATSGNVYTFGKSNNSNIPNLELTAE